MSRISHILFDLGNTLLHFDGNWQDVFTEGLAAMESMAARMSLAVRSQTLVAHFRRRMEAYYLQRELDLVEQTSARILETSFADLKLAPPSKTQLTGLLDVFYAETQQHWHLEEHALETVKTLRLGGYGLGILSNAAHDLDVQVLVKRAGLHPFMDFVLTSAGIGLRKPHPEAFASALAHWKVPPEAALMVGDTPGADILGARNSGMTSVWVRRFAQPQPEPPIDPDYAIDALADLPGLLSQINS